MLTSTHHEGDNDLTLITCTYPVLFVLDFSRLHVGLRETETEAEWWITSVSPLMYVNLFTSHEDRKKLDIRKETREKRVLVQAESNTEQLIVKSVHTWWENTLKLYTSWTWSVTCLRQMSLLALCMYMYWIILLNFHGPLSASVFSLIERWFLLLCNFKVLFIFIAWHFIDIHNSEFLELTDIGSSSCNLIRLWWKQMSFLDRQNNECHICKTCYFPQQRKGLPHETECEMRTLVWGHL